MVGGNGNRNPYIIGRPINSNETEKFFGRETLFKFIEDNLLQGSKIILLHGQRRIGKSSVLKHIPNFITNDEFVFVQFDLQHRIGSNLSNILYNLATEIIHQLGLDGIKCPTETEFTEIKNCFHRRFLPQVYELIEHKKLVLLLDEFDVANQNNNGAANSEQGTFFLYINQLLKEQENLFIIPVVGRYLNDLPNLRKLFKNAPFQEIGLLDDIGAKQLIIKTAEGKLNYQPEAIERILQLTAGHPYFTQTICFSLFEQARNDVNWTVSFTDIEHVFDQAIANSEAGLRGLWNVLTIPERVIISSVAEAKNIANQKGTTTLEEPLIVLKRKGVVSTEPLIQACERLKENHYLDNDGCKLTVEFICHWLIKHHPLRDEISELENLEIQTVQPLQTAANLLRDGAESPDSIIMLYERALTINPNNFSIILLLAQEYLHTSNFEKALELFRRCYQVKPEYYREAYLTALTTYGHHLITQRQFTLAKLQYQIILEIEPNRASARERLEEIEAYQRKNTNYIAITWRTLFDTLQLFVSTPVLSLLITGIASLSVGIGIYRYISPCAEGEQKKLGFLCVNSQNSNFSKGERTFFPNLQNPKRDEGTKLFAKGKYPEAVKSFEQAVADNRNDPEVLIYYNNALAYQKKEPFTLAVAVPVGTKSNIAQEILRGVAQAQHEFNSKGGLNGRLLEIIIANDANDREQAKYVAFELVNNQSILGVIGHYSSGVTEVALEEYNKTEIPVISPTSTSISLQGEYFFRTVPSDAAAGKKMAEYAFKTMNINKVVIFFNPRESYSDSMREEFTKRFEHLTGQVVRKINLADNQFDARKEVAVSLFRYQAGAAVLFPDAGNTNAALKIAQESQDLLNNPQNQNRQRLKLFGGDTLYSNETLNLDRDAVEDLALVVSWFRDFPQAKKFAQKSAQQWGGGVSWRTATSYDATQAFIQALATSPTHPTRSRVIDSLKNINLSKENTSGEPLRFTPDRERQIEPFIVTVKNRKFVAIPQQ
ncbi:MAG: ABC transporter substrate-binding protein [Calothrix sp. C42_A2020_038]|nr:ABC transporter substrate-binding protein [Calothrix sp. C42_A2020_038]